MSALHAMDSSSFLIIIISDTSKTRINYYLYTIFGHICVASGFMFCAHL